LRIKTMPLHTTAATAARAKMSLNRLNPGIEVKTGINQYSSRPHIHQSWSLSIVLRGATRVSLGNWKSELVEDQFIAIPPGMPHLCSPEPLQPFGYAVLYLPLDYIDTASTRGAPAYESLCRECIDSPHFQRKRQYTHVGTARMHLRAARTSENRRRGNGWQR